MSADPVLLSRVLKAFSLFALATGSTDAYLGTAAASGEKPSTPQQAVVDSQFRFLGAMWAGYGVMLWWISNDLKARQVPLALLGGTMVGGGVARGLSAMKYGLGPTWIKVALGVELLGPGAVYLWGRALGVWT